MCLKAGYSHGPLSACPVSLCYQSVLQWRTRGILSSLGIKVLGAPELTDISPLSHTRWTSQQPGLQGGERAPVQ